MDIRIDDSKVLKDIKKEFTDTFPYLWLEFFHHPHGDHEPSPMGDRIIDAEQMIGQVRQTHNEGDLTITPSMKVQELEQAFWERFGLSVQVFRKSKGKWFETTKTDHWTLEEQMQAAKDMKESHGIPWEEFIQKLHRKPGYD